MKMKNGAAMFVASDSMTSFVVFTSTNWCRYDFTSAVKTTMFDR